jgi:hypothetical protein
MTRVLVGVPCYRGDPHAQASWVDAVARELRLDMQVAIVADATCLPEARTCLAELFLGSTFDVWLMKDDDVWAAPGVVRRLLDAARPAAVAPYQVRGQARFDVTFLPDGTVQSAGLGLCAVTRAVVERLWSDWHEELHHITDDGREWVSIFEPGFGTRENGTRKKLGEDHCFWWRVRRAGFPVVALDDVVTVHAGVQAHYKRAA